MVLESCITYLCEMDPGSSAQLRGLLLDIAQCFVVLNEQCSRLQAVAPPSETLLHRAARMAAGCCLFLKINFGVDVTVLAIDDNDPVLAYCKEMGVPCETVSEFLRSRGLHGLADETELIISSLMNTPFDSDVHYPAHLSPADIKKGLNSGEIFMGTLSTYRHNCFEGEVEVDEGSSIFLVRGRRCMNRAMDGDTVFVRRSGAESQDSGESPEEEDVLRGPSVTSGLPLAEVVGIAKRPARRVVASLPRRAQTSRAEGREEYIFVAPADKKLPRFRVRTRQRHLLEGRRFVIGFDSWPRGSKYPNGRFLK